MSPRWLETLAGEWKGEGTATFPTIETVEYREHLRFEKSPLHARLFYEQRTWIESPEARNGEPLHWESGFLEHRQEGLVQLINCQNNGRLEVLEGTASVEGSAQILSLASSGIYNDDRMLSSRRRVEVTTDRISYALWMMTTAVDQTTLHLEANLHRSD